MDFKEVSQKARCRICKKASWCSFSICGEFTICRREQHFNAITKEDKNGNVYYVYSNKGIKNYE